MECRLEFKVEFKVEVKEDFFLDIESEEEV